MRNGEKWAPQAMAEPAVLEALDSSQNRGLSSRQVSERLEKWGPNELEGQKKESFLRRFLRQFADFMILILLVAAVVSAAVEFWQGEGLSPDPLIILFIVVCNALIGAIQESRAEKAIEALKRMSAPHARVRREGKEENRVVSGLVPGDIILLQAGDVVPADARLLLDNGMKTDESPLTGESMPVEKWAAALHQPDTPPADCSNMVYAGTSVVMGSGEAVVTETGMRTQMGRIAGMIAHSEPPRTPLQNRLARMSRGLGIAVLVICAALFLIGLLQHRDPLSVFLIAVSLAVAAIPEGLPVVVTVVLACGVRRLAIHRAVVRRLPAVETLGNAAVICTDKTGTLTCGEMTVTCLSDGLSAVPPGSSREREILSCCALCSSCEKKDGKWRGDPTEKALVSACPTPLSELRRRFPLLRQIPFSSQKKQMTTLHQREKGGTLLIVKGAPEVVLARCQTRRAAGGEVPLSLSERRKILRENERMAGQALRVLAVAVYRGSPPREGEEEKVPLCFLGLCGLQDPPRKGVKQAVSVCRRAGIRPVMITGDQPATAAAIARQIGIKDPDRVITGKELDTMDEKALRACSSTCSVFARVQPRHKVLLVQAFQQQGLITAMTGDGINDAPALRMADIGCAMGKSGTEVARQAADMVLTDDRFETIVQAVREGRGIFENIRKTVHFLLSCNTGEILTVVAAFLLGLPSPLLAVQLLWVNLVTDSLPALALGTDAIEEDRMRCPPVSDSHKLFRPGEGMGMILEGCLIGALALLAFTFGRVYWDIHAGRTMAFGVLSLSQLSHTLNMHSSRPLLLGGAKKSGRLLLAIAAAALLQVLVMAVPVWSPVFGVVPLTGMQWGLVALLSLVPLLTEEVQKWLWGRRKRKFH